MYQGSDKVVLIATLHALEMHKIESGFGAQFYIKADDKSVDGGLKLWKDFLKGKKCGLSFRANLDVLRSIQKEYVRTAVVQGHATEVLVERRWV